MTDFNAAHWLVDRHVDEGRGDRVAIRCQGRSTTYAELQQSVWRAQRLLAGLGIEPGERVTMVVRDDEAFPAFFLGGLRSGIVPVPLSTMLKGPALGDIVADAGARALVVSDVFADAVPDVVAAAPSLEHVVVCGDASAVPDTGSVSVHAWSAAVDDEPVAAAPTTTDSPAFWLYSSGTTGKPKGVMHVHGNLRATYETYAQQVLQVTEDDRFLSVAKLFFAFGLGNSLTFPFAAGATTILNPDPPTPAGIAALVAEERPTLLFSSPGFCAALLDAAPPASTFESVRATVTAGESLPANIQVRFAAMTGGAGPRRHRLDRAAPHLPVQHARRPGARVIGLGRPRLRRRAARRRRQPGDRDGHAWLPVRAGRLGGHRLLGAARRDRGGVR